MRVVCAVAPFMARCHEWLACARPSWRLRRRADGLRLTWRAWLCGKPARIHDPHEGPAKEADWPFATAPVGRLGERTGEVVRCF